MGRPPLLRVFSLLGLPACGSVVWGLSGKYYGLLWRRAERFLLRAVRDYEKGDYDGACFNAKEAVQLAAEAVLYRYFGETPRIHGSRALLAMPRNLLMDAGRDDVAALLGKSASDYRDALDILEESYTMARYGEVSYGRRQGRLCVDTARRALEVLRSVEERLG